MLLPDKHVGISESILALSALVLASLESPRQLDQLMAMLSPKFGTSDWPAFHSTETVSLALCLLYAMGLVDVAENGDIHKCAS